MPIVHLDSNGVYEKQKSYVQVVATLPASIEVAGTQTNAYLGENTTYTLDIRLTTELPQLSTNNTLRVVFGGWKQLYSVQCSVGCSAFPLTDNNTFLLTINNTLQIRIIVETENPITMGTVEVSSYSSFGQMGHGKWTPPLMCTLPCRSCPQNNPSHCLSCYLWSSNNKLWNNTCSSDCSPSFFFDSQTNTCEPCH